MKEPALVLVGLCQISLSGFLHFAIQLIRIDHFVAMRIQMFAVLRN
jgi:hypothetical protein